MRGRHSGAAAAFRCTLGAHFAALSGFKARARGTCRATRRQANCGCCSSVLGSRRRRVARRCGDWCKVVATFRTPFWRARGASGVANTAGPLQVWWEGGGGDELDEEAVALVGLGFGEEACAQVDGFLQLHFGCALASQCSCGPCGRMHWLRTDCSARGSGEPGGVCAGGQDARGGVRRKGAGRRADRRHRSTPSAIARSPTPSSRSRCKLLRCLPPRPPPPPPPQPTQTFALLTVPADGGGPLFQKSWAADPLTYTPGAGQREYGHVLLRTPHEVRFRAQLIRTAFMILLQHTSL